MINIKDKQSCCGCGACSNICPRSCISMLPDKEGFLYPQVNKSKCIDCGLCDKVCTFKNPFEYNPTDKIYACRNKDEEVRLKSSSGGIFLILANYILEQNGVVFGVCFDERFKVKHIYVENKNDLEKLCGSKYVQSDVGDTFKQCENFLRNDKKVLFSGTPCQIAGLKHYLKKEYNDLLCVDVACHGVPSPKAWDKYKTELENENNCKLVEFGFKNKITGWKKCSFAYKFANGIRKSEPAALNSYFIGFLSELYSRPSCYNCKAKNFRSGSDITLADYWGVETKFPEIDDDKGVSLLLINTEHGQQMFNKLKENMYINSTEIEHAVMHNPCIVKSIAINKNRDKFFKLVDKLTFEKSIEKCLSLTILQRIKLIFL